VKCFYCGKEACAKVGTSEGSIFSALLGKKCLSKKEIYVCKKHFDNIEKLELKDKARKEAVYSSAFDKEYKVIRGF